MKVKNVSIHFLIITRKTLYFLRQDESVSTSRSNFRAPKELSDEHKWHYFQKVQSRDEVSCMEQVPHFPRYLPFITFTHFKCSTFTNRMSEYNMDQGFFVEVKILLRERYVRNDDSEDAIVLIGNWICV